FNVVLIEPEIPPNTGNVGRLCLGTGSSLHLVKPLGFSLDDRELRRAGLDYWQEVHPQLWDSFEALRQGQPPDSRYFFLTTKSQRITRCSFRERTSWFLVGKRKGCLRTCSPPTFMIASPSQCTGREALTWLQLSRLCCLKLCANNAKQWWRTEGNDRHFVAAKASGKHRAHVE